MHGPFQVLFSVILQSCPQLMVEIIPQGHRTFRLTGLPPAVVDLDATGWGRVGS